MIKGRAGATWPTKTLTEVCQIRPPRAEARRNGNGKELVSFVPMEDLGINQKFLKPNQTKPLAEVAGSYTYFAEGDVLLAKITPCFENGKLGIAANLTNGVGFGSSEYIVFRPNTVLDSQWLYYYLAREDFRLEGAARMGGAVGHKRVSKEFIESYQIPLPPVSEQRRIVGILDKAFDTIATAKANAEKSLQNARALFESHLAAVFSTRGHVTTVRIGDVAAVYDGPHATPKTVDVGPVFLGISALQDGRVNLSETRHVTAEDFRRWTRRVKPQPNDIVFSYETRLGQAAIIPDGLECCLGRRMGLIRPDAKRLDPRFFVYQYISPPFRQYLASRTVRGATVDRISLKEFPSFPIAISGLADQRRVADECEAVRSETARLESLYRQKLAALEALKQSLLHQAFTGAL